MRQAGRYLPQYRRVREQVTFLDLCRNSELAAEVTVDAARFLEVDAAIVFADILLPLVPMGLGLRFEKGDGPVIDRPLRTAEAIEALPNVNVRDALGFVARTIELTCAELGDAIPTIGFAGAPFTLAAYAIEGGSSKNFIATKTLMYTQRRAWSALMNYLVELTAEYLALQIDAGAAAVQLFDSWVGCLTPNDYRQFVLPYTQRIIAKLGSRVPVIYFGTDTATQLESIRACGADVIGLDWRVDLDRAWDTIGRGTAIQGNFDPAKLFADPATIRAEVLAILARANGSPGHIFNLGHGVLPGTPVDSVRTLIDSVHEYSRR